MFKASQANTQDPGLVGLFILERKIPRRGQRQKLGTNSSVIDSNTGLASHIHLGKGSLSRVQVPLLQGPPLP